MLTRTHDLPPLWDGMRVDWRPWTPGYRTTLDLHLAQPDSCDHCGSTEPPATTSGTVYAAGQGLLRFLARDHHGAIIRASQATLGYPVRWFIAYRCPDCGTDEVWDRHSGETWTLDADDYSDDGSWPC